MTFPYNQEGQLPTVQGILGGVASAVGGIPVLQVSTVNSGGTVSLNGDASNNRVSAFSQDASLFRVSALGVTVTSAPLSADSSRISAIQDNASVLNVSAKSLDGGTFRVSAIVDSGSISAVQTDATKLSVSAVQKDAGLFRVSAIMDSGSVSARSGDANQVHVSAVQGDSGLLRISAILAAGVSSVGAASFGVSAAQLDAGVFRTSAILAAGVSSVGAASFGVSAAQNDAGALHASAYAGDANQLHTSAVQGDAALQRTSALNSVATGSTGGASYYWTSSGLGTQASAVKAAAGRLYGYHIGNPAGVDQYLQVFNMSGGATPATDVPALTLYVPTLGGAVMSLGVGVAFTAGISIVGTSTVNGSTMGASAMRINLFYA